MYLDQIGRHPLLTAEVMGFSRERARQVERDALGALRSPELRVRLQGFSGAA